MRRAGPFVRALGVGPGLGVLLGLGSVACGDGAPGKELPPPPGRRSEVVTGTARPATTVAAAAKPTAKPKAPRVLCDRAPAADGKMMPAAELVRVEEGGPSLAEDISTGNGQWTWVNLWAGWCAPCKEEMPMLAAWESKLRAAGTPVRFAFLSIDDDERQARRFLASQQAVKRSWRLPEGEGRTAWLEAVGLPASPELPVHVLFDGSGALRCVVTGAISEADFPRVQAIVAKR